MGSDYIGTLNAEMERSLDSLKREFSKVRTGRASISLLDGIKVDYYGTQTPLNQIATLSVPEPRLITIQPWDATVIKEIEKAIQKSDLGLMPVNDGKLIRVSIPPLTEQRRVELVKVAKKMAENGKVSIRNHRRDINEELKQKKKDKEVSEDEFFMGQKEVQDITDDYIKKCDDLTQAKEKEILEF
jgi:ribosome recycling factor